MIDYIIYIIPLICVFGVSLFVDMDKNAGSNVWFRPPGYMFSVIWSILLILLGITMYHSFNYNHIVFYMHILIVILLSAWISIYNAHKTLALWWIIITLLFVSVTYTLTDDKKIKCLYIPLMIWLSIASLLMMFDNKN